MIAHAGVLPAEELLPLVGGAGAGILLVRTWAVAHLQGRGRRARQKVALQPGCGIDHLPFVQQAVTPTDVGPERLPGPKVGGGRNPSS